MTRVVDVPVHFEFQALDQFAKSFGTPDQTRLLFDAHPAKWASPYGLLSMLVAGQWLKEHDYPRPQFTIPQDRDVAHYWSRAGFFHFAAEYFDLHGKVPRAASGSSDSLLDVTPVTGADDVHTVVGRVQDRSAAIMAELGLGVEATLGFAMALSEGCQNIIEHAGTVGWVAVQSYHWRQRLGRRVVVIAVADAGIGFRGSLEPTQATRVGARWGDAAALEAAVFQGVSRFGDPGRGQGIAGMRRYIGRWDGKLSLRSGAARLSIVPPWDDDVPIASDIPHFPGSQLLIIIPAKESR